MRYSKGKSLAIILIVIGALMLFGKFVPFLGALTGAIMGYLVPIAMIALGYYGVKRGNTLIGYIVLVIGVLVLLSKLAWLIGPIIAIGLIVFGIYMLKDNRSSRRY